MDMKLLKKRYIQQRSQSKARKDKFGNDIQWNLTFEQWLKIWMDSGKLDERGRGRGKYVMSRYNDIGPYSVDNVEIKLNSDNVSEAHYGISKGISHSGELNPNARVVTTVDGTFNTFKEAAKFYGISSQALRYRIKKNPGILVYG